ncbi:hypothetical protein LPB140_05795 [Sphingorhabdus lutea]|uniref:Tim44-like domain-containing protein n=2 Tax=Sphingorhabdus lutea TaxID=1913578 RepID=A0A1L3JET2_9SPHN|nr:hypothetical protein LPB140_05795 [Sphingorhabdus lutea]
MVAAFLGLRLYSVLGKRTGHEQEQLPRQMDEERRPPIQQAEEIIPARTPAKIVKAEDDLEQQNLDILSQSGLRSIMNADKNFNLLHFAEGAHGAYDVILKAFWQGDKASLREYCDDSVYNEMSMAIDMRDEAGEVLENKLIRIEESRIVEATFNHPIAQIKMQFKSDISALVKNKEGEIIGGSLSDAVQANDIWTFERNIKNGTPNWTLVETDIA